MPEVSRIARPLATAGCLLALLTGPVQADTEFLNASGIMPEGLPFSEAVRVGETYYLSGQVGVVPGRLALVPGGIEAEARQAMENIGAVLEAQDLNFGHLVKCTVMLADMADWDRFNAIYREYVRPPYPARSAFATGGLALDARVEIECIATADQSAAS